MEEINYEEEEEDNEEEEEDEDREDSPNKDLYKVMTTMYLLRSLSAVFHQLGGLVLDNDLTLVGLINPTLLVRLSKRLCLLCFNGRQVVLL